LQRSVNAGFTSQQNKQSLSLRRLPSIQYIETFVQLLLSTKNLRAPVLELGARSSRSLPSLVSMLLQEQGRHVSRAEEATARVIQSTSAFSNKKPHKSFLISLISLIISSVSQFHSPPSLSVRFRDRTSICQRHLSARGERHDQPSCKHHCSRTHCAAAHNDTRTHAPAILADARAPPVGTQTTL
jgi:hypothetical protein